MQGGVGLAGAGLKDGHAVVTPGSTHSPSLSTARPL